jgi:hypothetical protein
MFFNKASANDDTRRVAPAMRVPSPHHPSGNLTARGALRAYHNFSSAWTAE